MKAAQKEQQESRDMRNVENWLALMSGSCTNRVDAKDNEQLRDSLGRDRLWTVPLALLKGPIGVAPTGWFLPWGSSVHDSSAESYSCCGPVADACYTR